MVMQVYTVNNSSGKDAVDPAHFLKRISQLPAGAEFCDGGQHDGHELLRLLLHSLHDDLVSSHSIHQLSGLPATSHLHHLAALCSAHNPAKSGCASMLAKHASAHLLMGDSASNSKQL